MRQSVDVIRVVYSGVMNRSAGVLTRLLLPQLALLQPYIYLTKKAAQFFELSLPG